MFIQCSDLVFSTAQGMTSQIGHGDIKIGKKIVEECLKNVILKLEKQDRAWGYPKLNKYFCST